MKERFDKEICSSLPPCPICGKPPKVSVDQSDKSVWIWMTCKNRCYPIRTHKASLQQATDSIKSKWRKYVRTYPNHNISWWC